MIVQIITPSLKSSVNNYEDYFNLYENEMSSLVRIKDFPAEKNKSVLNFLLENNIEFKLKDIDSNISDLYIKLSSDNLNIIVENSGAVPEEVVFAVNRYLNYDKIIHNISGRNFCFGKCYLMGILNVTPDSFSDGGLYTTKDSAISKGLEMIDEGADIIDVGGESSRPGAESISEEEEKRRIIPVIEGILNSRPNAIISVDTYKAKVAKAALEKGAQIINDISGGTFQPEILDAVSEYDASMVIMHIKGTPKNMQKDPKYENLIEEIYDFLYIRVQKAKEKGIKNIFVDPGIGFGKTVDNNFEIIKRLEDFKSLGCPILIGLSRKSFIGKTLNLEVNERETATSILESVSVTNGARIIRTHNIKNGLQVCKLLNTINQNV